MGKIDKIILATTNQGKLKELRKLLEGYPVVLGSLSEVEKVEDFEEKWSNFSENAKEKAKYYSVLSGNYVIADDSGLKVDILDGKPGVHSARFAGVQGPDRDRANNQKLLEMLADFPMEKRTAHFCCCLCLCKPGEVVFEVQGQMEGLIIDSPRGDNGFGYDPIFYLPQLDKTVAQLSAEEKNKISHRGQALRELLKKLAPLLG
jgi:non-canonical purine NTP pyrophosphatase (RdgB/HAM1 family)